MFITYQIKYNMLSINKRIYTLILNIQHSHGKNTNIQNTFFLIVNHDIAV